MPNTTDAAPLADAPKPPATLFAPAARGCADVTVVSATNGPDLPLLMWDTTVSNPTIAVPRLVYVLPFTV
ncbi:hypothetical protein D3C73_811890 [compost metagenome]